MELCDMSLHYYIHGERQFNFIESPVAVSKDSPLSLKMLNVWTVMYHITRGLEFYSSIQASAPRLETTKQYFHSRNVADLDLYYSPKNAWKIADFGITVEGTSSRAQST